VKSLFWTLASAVMSISSARSWFWRPSTISECSGFVLMPQSFPKRKVWSVAGTVIFSISFSVSGAVVTRLLSASTSTTFLAFPLPAFFTVRALPCADFDTSIVLLLT